MFEKFRTHGGGGGDDILLFKLPLLFFTPKVGAVFALLRN
jgi:hypothetical protein